jgi:hypothetical protein
LLSYDHPLIFICKSETGKNYLFNEWVENKESDEWLVIKLSSKRANDLSSCHTSLFEAYCFNEYSFLKLVKKNYETDEITIKQITRATINNYLTKLWETSKENMKEVQ